jgi:hypothetical protein
MRDRPVDQEMLDFLKDCLWEVAGLTAIEAEGNPRVGWTTEEWAEFIEQRVSPRFSELLTLD